MVRRAYVLGEIIQTLDRSGVPYVFIYLSDHGESLLEDGVMFHGMCRTGSFELWSAHGNQAVRSASA